MRHRIPVSTAGAPGLGRTHAGPRKTAGPPGLVGYRPVLRLLLLLALLSVLLGVPWQAVVLVHAGRVAIGREDVIFGNGSGGGGGGGGVGVGSCGGLSRGAAPTHGAGAGPLQIHRGPRGS